MLIPQTFAKEPADRTYCKKFGILSSHLDLEIFPAVIGQHFKQKIDKLFSSLNVVMFVNFNKVPVLNKLKRFSAVCKFLYSFVKF